MNDEPKPGRTTYTAPEKTSLEPAKETGQSREGVIRLARARAIVRQLDFYVAKYEEATRAWTQSRNFKRMTASLARAMERGMWTDMVDLCTTSFRELREVYPAPDGTWLGPTADCPEIEAHLEAFGDRLHRVGQAIVALPSLVSMEDRGKAVGVLATCSEEMRKKAKEICDCLLERIRALVKELSKVVG